MTDPWDRRIRRAETLEKEWPFASEILRFFRELSAFQATIASRIPHPDADRVAEISPFLPELIRLLREKAPAGMAELCSILGDCPEEERRRILAASDERGGPADEDAVLGLLRGMLLHPCAVNLTRTRKASESAEKAPSGTCPVCASAPIASLLREDKSAETVRRTLVCSTCAFEWDFPRVLCPGCGEERPEKLPRYAAEEIPWVRVEACDSCRRYLKAVNLTKNPDADPVVDELGSIPLDVIAREKGYEKITPNLAGI